MPNTQLELRAQQYGRNIMMLAQQKYSKLYPAVTLKTDINGKTFFQDQIGEWEMATKGSLNPDTPENDPEFARRMGTIITKNDNRFLDRSVNLQIMSDPKAPMSMSAGSSIGRTIDDEIITALTGNSFSGETGATTIALPAAQIILNGATNLTFAKVKEAKQKFDDNNVEEEDRFFVISPSGVTSLLDDTNLTSSDFNTINAINAGTMPKDGVWMGFKWIISTRLSVTANIVQGIAFQKYGICLGMTEMPFVRTDERNDKSYSWQIYYELNLGAIRLEEVRVVRVDYDETA
jgi:hypothetical protein